MGGLPGQQTWSPADLTSGLGQQIRAEDFPVDAFRFELPADLISRVGQQTRLADFPVDASRREFSVSILSPFGSVDFRFLYVLPVAGHASQ